MTANCCWLGYSERDEWSERLARFPSRMQDIYYSPEYVNLYNDDGRTPVCFIYSEGEKIYLYPFLLQQIPQLHSCSDIITPYGYGGPIYTSNSREFLARAYECFKSGISERNVVAELIKFHPILNNQQALKDVIDGSVMAVCPTVYAISDISDDHRWIKVYTHANRKNINKAMRNGAQIRIGQSPEDWSEFIRLYEKNLLFNDSRSEYYFSESYYSAIRDTLEGHYKIFSVIIDCVVVASILVLLGKQYAHCHLLGTDPEYRNVGVTNFLHHELILWCKSNGYNILHMGGGRSNSESDSLLKFKKNFSSELAIFHIGECVHDSGKYKLLCAQWESENPQSEFSNRLLKYRY